MRAFRSIYSLCKIIVFIPCTYVFAVRIEPIIYYNITIKMYKCDLFYIISTVGNIFVFQKKKCTTHSITRPSKNRSRNTFGLN